MRKTRKKTFLTAFALLAVILAVSALPAEAAGSKWGQRNKTTGYTAVIDDAADLLTDQEEKDLMEVMKPVTESGHVLFVTGEEAYSGSINAHCKQILHEEFGNDSATLFMIDMYGRKLYIFSYGKLWDVITNSRADTITDNVYRKASREQYFDCAKEVFLEERALLRGEKIAEPMRTASNAVLALFLALLLNFVIVRALTRVRPTGDREMLKFVLRRVECGPITAEYSREDRVYSPRTSSSDRSGSSCSSCSSGSSCSSCGGGSSCSSCGGGGGHSF